MCLLEVGGTGAYGATIGQQGQELMKKCLCTYVPHFVSLKDTKRRGEGCQTGKNNSCPLDRGTQELNIFSFSLWLMGLVINAGRKLLFQELECMTGPTLIPGGLQVIEMLSGPLCSREKMSRCR